MKKTRRCGDAGTRSRKRTGMEMKGYRWLRVGEVLREGDECCPCTGSAFQTNLIGEKVEGVHTYRRKVEPSVRGGRVVLTRRQAGLLVSVAEAYAKVHGLTPDESLLVGAAARRVRTANGRESTRMKSGN